jgi:hypothetical protein
MKKIFFLCLLLCQIHKQPTKIVGYCGRPDENGVICIAFRMIFLNGFKRLINNGYTHFKMQRMPILCQPGSGHVDSVVNDARTLGKKCIVRDERQRKF